MPAVDHGRREVEQRGQDEHGEPAAVRGSDEGSGHGPAQDARYCRLNKDEKKRAVNSTSRLTTHGFASRGTFVTAPCRLCVTHQRVGNGERVGRVVRGNVGVVAKVTRRVTRAQAH